MKILCAILIQLSIPILVAADSYSTRIEQYAYKVTSSTDEEVCYYVTEYIISNNTSMPIFTWFDLDGRIGENIEKRIKRYFFKPKHDLSLFGLMTDNVVGVDWDKPIVGLNFIKKIEPNRQFSFVFLSKEGYLEEEYFNKTITITEIHSINRLVDIIDERYLFHQDKIVINKNELNE